MENQRKLVITLSVNASDDVSTVAFTVANAALSKGFKVGMFLTSDGVELSRTNSCEFTHVQPFKQLPELIKSFTNNKGTIWSCSPCFNHRGLDSQDIVEGAVVIGAGPMLDWISEGAQTLSF